MSALPSLSSPLIGKRKREFTYHIFLSFYGKDTRNGFTSHLYKALTKQEIKTFRDDKSLERGEDFSPELLRAIRESWGSIVVLSNRYAFSCWCLDELVEIMKQRKMGHRVYTIFYDVAPCDIRHQRNTVEEAFAKHEKRHKEKTQSWRVALKEVADIHGWSLKDQNEADYIEDIVNDLSKKIFAEILYPEKVEKMKSNFRKVQAWLVDAENKQYMEGETLKVWLDELKHLAYDMDDVLDELNTSVLKSKIERDQGQTTSTSLSSLSKVHNIPPRIKELEEKYQVLVKEKEGFHFALGLNNSCTDLTLERPKTTSFIDESNVCGRDREKDELIRLLLSDNNGEGGSGKHISLTAIVGMGGLGKTTLAQLIYNSDQVKDHFPHRIWVCVSRPFDEVRIARAILEALRVEHSKLNELQSLLEEISQNIKEKKFLLVLDDVWIKDEEKWKELKLSNDVGSPNSKILVTTRDVNVARILSCPRPFLLGVLSDEDGWSLFSKIAFSGRSSQDCEDLESIGRKFTKKCEGLPLAIKTLASLLCSKRTIEEWKGILGSDMWKLHETEDLFSRVLFSTLLLSYYDLSWPLRQCFSYCAIFPKDHKMKKDVLIKLWMAQGFLVETGGKSMEIVGEGYFDILAERSFFQEFEKDADDSSIIIGCKMHDILHDFAQLLRKTECCVVASNGIEEQRAECCHENVRHLSLVRENERVGIPDPIYNVKLRSFLVDSGPYGTSALEASLPNLFVQLACLRVLNLSTHNFAHSNSIKVFPQEIGKLMSLRYLSLEGNVGLVELPEALCDLCNLQTLNIRGCGRLQKLPHGMEKLINLRHLQNDGTYSLAFMPKGMQRLTCLQTLELFLAAKEEGIERETSLRLAYLGNLIHLRGNLEIKELGKVATASELRGERPLTKTRLRELSLYFNGSQVEKELSQLEHWQRIRTMREARPFVLDALEPPQLLQSIRIRYFKGNAFPKWMPSLTSLKSVDLRWCESWRSLPPMGKLRCLESLTIWYMTTIKKVGQEFVGVETSSSSVNQNIAFPNLKTLDFRYMKTWEEWEYEEVSNLTIMPKLQCLSIGDCPKLKTLPRCLLESRALQELRIIRCPILFELYKEKTGKDWPSISHIPIRKISK